MSSAEQPLIANPDASDELDHDGFAEDGVSTVQQKQADRSSLGLFVWLLAFSAGISGLLFGCGCLICWLFSLEGRD